MEIRLRYLLVAVFTIVATVPVLILATWVERNALRQEIERVREKHLLLAENTALVLDRYARDAERAFEQLVRLHESGTTLDPGFAVAARHGFRHFCVIDADGNIVAHTDDGHDDVDLFHNARVGKLLSTAREEVSYSNIMADNAGTPTIFLTRRVGADHFAVAAMDPEFIIALQTAITFGQKGHAAIVDEAGNVIAHPNRAWQKSIKNLSKVRPVKKMMAGRNGVTTFFSPAVKMDMISGFTTVPRTGWGVMVPQPMDELIAQAHAVKRNAVTLAAFGVVAAALLGWFIAGRIIRPVDAVRLTARRIAEGKLNSRVPPMPALATSDLRELADGFDEMAQRIQDDQKSLAEALSRAQSADRAKSQFLANMSHELRTPLNAIIGFSETMERQVLGPVDNEKYLSYATDIRESGEHLLSIIRNILDLSKIETGNMEVEDDIVEIPEIVDSALDMVRLQARETRIDLAVKIDDSLPQIRGSEVKLKQVLVNLLSNAVKYTPEGGRVDLTATRDYGGGIVIGIADTGVGMSRADLTVALIPFGRAADQVVMSAGGTGLGLPIAKRLTEIHGGSLEIDSEEGAGTKVLIHLPAARVIAKVA